MLLFNGILNYIACFGWLIPFLFGLLGLLLGWLLFRGKKQAGDLSIEGEGALRAEADSLRVRVQELEGRVSTRDGEVSTLKGKLAAAAAGATAVAATAAATKGDDDETYALEWRNRYLAARVKYLEGRVAEAPKPKAKKVVAKKKAAPKPKPKPKAKPKAKAKPKPKVLYTDGPTDGKPDDLKLIKGIGPKFEKDLNGKGIYYFRQIAAWKAKDVTMVEGVIDSFPGRIGRDEWVKQAKGLATGGKPRAMKAAPAAAKKGKSKSSTASKASDANAKYLTNVRKFDKKANADVVNNIVKYCGVALRTRDGSLVACSDEAEKGRVAKGFATKKLGLKTGQDELVNSVCQQMKGERFKNRVTFYYLAAKKAGKLSVFGG